MSLVTIKLPPDGFDQEENLTLTVRARIVCEYFAVHRQTHASRYDARAIKADKWNVTHIASGFACISDIPRHEDAMRAAKMLAAIDTNWDFSNPETVKTWPKETMAKIHAVILQFKPNAKLRAIETTP